MTEKTIQEAIQTVLVATATFDAGDVTIDDWGVLDQSTASAPYVIISVADDFEISFLGPSDESKWGVALNVVERFTDWDATRQAIRDTRAAVIAAISSPSNAVSGLAVKKIRSSGAVDPIYETYGQAEILPDAIPVFLSHRLIAECEEY